MIYYVENAHKQIYTIKIQAHEWTKNMNRQFTKEKIVIRNKHGTITTSAIRHSNINVTLHTYEIRKI